MKTQSALPWFGSDSEVAEDLAAYLNHCRHVTIPFCGGLGILPYLLPRHIVANDLHEDAINFYRYLTGIWGENAKDAVIHHCQRTLSHPSEMENAQAVLSDPTKKNTSLAAWAFWTICWLGRKGKGGTKNQNGLPSVRRTASGGSNASRIRAASGDLQAWATEFERCEWESVDFRVQLKKVADDAGCGIYLDPPWDQLGDGYLHGFTRQDHVDLRDLLATFTQTVIVLRYGDTPLIRELYAGWTIIEAESRNQANAVKGELWILRNCPLARIATA